MRANGFPAGLLQGALQQVTLRGVIIDNQDRRGIAKTYAARDGRHQFLAVDRFVDVVGDAEGIALGTIIDHGQHHHRDGRGLRIVFQPRQHVPAVQAGHQDIQYDHIRLEFNRLFDSRLAVVRGLDQEAFAGKQAIKHVMHGFVVVDDQYPADALAALIFRLIALARGGGIEHVFFQRGGGRDRRHAGTCLELGFGREFEHEYRALARLAGCDQASTH